MTQNARFVVALLFSGLLFGVGPAAHAAIDSSSADSLSAPLTSSDGSSIFDDIRLHAGVAFVNSYQDFGLTNGNRKQGDTNGFQLSLGMDLFSPHWIAETVFISLPKNNVSNADLACTTFELRGLYETAILLGTTFHIGLGIDNRSYDISDAGSDQSFNSGATAMLAGLDYWPTGHVSLGAELGLREPMVSGDPSSVDLTIQLNGHF